MVVDAYLERKGYVYIYNKDNPCDIFISFVIIW